MKIKPSLKIRFIVSMILLASAMAIFFSVLTLNYFVQGLDRGQAQTMRDFAHAEGVEEGRSLSVWGYHVSSRWEDMPDNVKVSFENRPPTEAFKLDKRTYGGGIFSPPEEVNLIMKGFNKQGEVRYVSKTLLLRESFKGVGEAKLFPHFFWVIIVAVSAIIVFSLVLFVFISKVASPIESLKNWAKSIDGEKLKQPVPDFQYGELNTLADIIKTSLSSVQESLERERQFLTHASHELRTPISVIRTNTELLNKLYEKEQGTPKQLAVVERIDRAGRTMTNLTETLLWLSRDDLNLPQSDKVNLKDMIEELIVELTYLLKNKPVKLEVTTSDYILCIAEIPCRIVLANLIRNAFQHTMVGNITVTQTGGSISVVNSSVQKAAESTDLGFGLGLRLTKKLADRYGWHYTDGFDSATYNAQIELRPR